MAPSTIGVGTETTGVFVNCPCGTGIDVFVGCWVGASPMGVSVDWVVGMGDATVPRGTVGTLVGVCVALITVGVFVGNCVAIAVGVCWGGTDVLVTVGVLVGTV